jgi:hypothetical protein
MAAGEAGDNPKYIEFYTRVKMTDEEYKNNLLEVIKQVAREVVKEHQNGSRK